MNDFIGFQKVNELTGYGVGILLAIMLVEKVLKFMRPDPEKVAQERFEAALGRITDRLARIEVMTERLDELHARVDKNGVPMWYVRQDMQEEIHEIRKLMEKLTAKSN